MGQAHGQGRASRLLRRFPSGVVPALLLLCLPSSQAQQSPGPPAQNPNPPEVQAHEGLSHDPAGTAFQLHVERNLVTVRVVVRDSKDHPVGNLRQEDFRLFDDGKPQEILGFSLEAGHDNPAPEAAPATSVSVDGPAAGPSAALAAVAQRYVILYFDDLHLEAEGIGRTRDAAWGYVTTSVRPEDRVAIYTATGKDQLDFTGDRDKLHEALFHLAPRPSTVGSGCPNIGEYEAFQVTQQATEALAIVHVEAIYCDCGTIDQSIDPMTERSALLMGPPKASCSGVAKLRVEREAEEVWQFAHKQSQFALDGIEAAVRRLAAMPGQRTLVLVSPGFLCATETEKIDTITRRALQQDVVISAVDAAGLAAPSMSNLIAGRADLEARKTMLENTGAVASGDVLANLSAGTGGVFCHNTNDFNEGFRQAAAIPDVYYVLTFSPPNIKLNGRFHTLKVALNARGPYTIQARRGYFASEAGLAGQVSSEAELEKTVLSQNEIHGLAADVSAQAQKAGIHDSRILVNIHVDVRQLKFRKEADRSVDKLIFRTTLFDRDGKYMAAKEASLDLHLKDATLEKFSQSGINATTSFQVPPGIYRVREVVRDTGLTGTAALNRLVEVPSPPAPSPTP